MNYWHKNLQVLIFSFRFRPKDPWRDGEIQGVKSCLIKKWRRWNINYTTPCEPSIGGVVWLSFSLSATSQSFSELESQQKSKCQFENVSFIEKVRKLISVLYHLVIKAGESKEIKERFKKSSQYSNGENYHFVRHPHTKKGIAFQGFYQGRNSCGERVYSLPWTKTLTMLFIYWYAQRWWL